MARKPRPKVYERTDLTDGHHEINEQLYVDDLGVVRFRAPSDRSPMGAPFGKITLRNGKAIRSGRLKVGGYWYSLTAHQIAWYLHTGEWMTRNGVVHDDGNGLNNAADNLVEWDTRRRRRIEREQPQIDQDQDAETDHDTEAEPASNEIVTVHGCYVTPAQLEAVQSSGSAYSNLIDFVRENGNDTDRIHFKELLARRVTPGYGLFYLALRPDVIARFARWEANRTIKRLNWQIDLLYDAIKKSNNNDYCDPDAYKAKVLDWISQIDKHASDAELYANPSSVACNPMQAAKSAHDVSSIAGRDIFAGPDALEKLAQEQNDYILKLLE